MSGIENSFIPMRICRDTVYPYPLDEIWGTLSGFQVICKEGKVCGVWILQNNTLSVTKISSLCKSKKSNSLNNNIKYLLLPAWHGFSGKEHGVGEAGWLLSSWFCPLPTHFQFATCDFCSPPVLEWWWGTGGKGGSYLTGAVMNRYCGLGLASIQHSLALLHWWKPPVSTVSIISDLRSSFCFNLFCGRQSDLS